MRTRITRPTWAEISRTALQHNYATVRDYVAPDATACAVVKADAYGHGAVHVARTLVAQGAERLAVAYVEEAVALREEGISAPIVVLAAFGPGQERVLRKHHLTPVVSTPRTLDAVLAPAREGRAPLTVHLKVDTGMSRLGFTKDGFVAAAQRLAEAKGVELEGVMTHLASADEDRETTERQLDRFDDAVAALHAKGIRPPLVHACNSAGMAMFRKTHTLVRPGLLVYGIRPQPLSPAVDVRPVMTVSADVALVKDIAKGTAVSYGGRWVAPRDTRLGTIPLGYADGVPRTSGMREEGAFAIGGRRVPVRGTVCMDLTMVDLTGRPDAGEGSEAVLVGDDPGAWHVAEWAGTNAWEVVTRIGPRVPRVYVEGGRVVAVQSPFVRA